MPQPAGSEATPARSPGRTDYSLSEAAPLQLVRAIRDALVGLTQSQGLVFLSLLELTHNTPDHRVTITARDLCKHAHTSTTRLARDTAQLQSRNLIRVEEGGKHQPNRYVVGWWNTVCVATLATPNGNGVATLATPTLDLVSSDWRHGVATLATPPTENKALTGDAPAVMNLSRISLTLIDQVFSSKAKNHDQNEVARCQSHLTAFMEKLGTDKDRRRWLDRPDGPPPCPANVAAQLIAAIPDRSTRETWLDHLMVRECHPYTYIWFIITALDRIHHITAEETKDGRAALHAAKRGQLIESEDPATGPQMRDEFQRDMARMARTKGMPRR